MTARRAARAPSRPAIPGPLLMAVALGAAALAQAAGAPGLVLAVAGMAIGAWVEATATRPGLDERPKKGTAPSPEATAAQREQRRWHQVAVGTTFPLPALAPGWPPLVAALAALVAATAGWSLPIAHLWGHVHMPIREVRAVNAVAAWWVTAGLAWGLRTSAGTACPGTRVNHLACWQALAGAGAGMVVGLAGALALWQVPTSTMSWPKPAGLATLVALGAVCGGWAGASRPALAHWRKTEAMRARWGQAWAELRYDPAPVLMTMREVGRATVMTWQAAPVHGARTFWPLSTKLGPYEPEAVVVILEHPDQGPNGPIAGTRHALRFDVAVWPGGLPDYCDPGTSPEEATLGAHCAMVLALEERGYGRAVPLGASRMGSPDAPRAVWQSRWAWPAGPSLAEVRPLRGELAERFGCPVVIDHRSDVLYFGAIGEAEAGLSDEEAATLERVADEDEWDSRWALVLKQGANPPTPQWSTAKDLPLANGAMVHRLAFVSRSGVDPASFQRLEPQLATVLDAAPFVAICGWPGQGRPGDRHPQAFAVYWSETVQPSSPEQLAPSPGAVWVLAGQVNMAFDAARLPRPEVVAARSLSGPDSQSVLWEVVLRLHGGATMAEVASKAPVLRQVMGVSWLVVEPGGEGAVLLMGPSPHSRSLVLAPGVDGLRLANAEWQAAWGAAGLRGTEGLRPRLVAMAPLPANPEVEALDFVLPPGLDTTTAKAGLGKLATAMSYGWVEARPSPLGPSGLRLLVAETDPLPGFVAFDFSAEASWSTGLPFATGVEGETVRFCPTESPHLLLAGATGSGKSSAAQALLWGAAAAGATLIVIDPVKGGADFAFLRAWTAAFATDITEAASVLDLLLAEVARRKAANAAAGVGSWAELAEPPPPLVVMVDEFTSLTVAGAKLPASPNETPAQTAAREALEAEAAARSSIAMAIARVAREARSAGVSLLLATQRLSAAMLDRMVGAEDLKVNLARALLGRASLPERQVALRDGVSAPSLGEQVPKGRGWFEPLSGPPQVVQCWWASQDDLAEALRARRPPPPPGSSLAALVGPGDEPELAVSMEELERREEQGQ